MSDIGDIKDVADVRLVQPSRNSTLLAALALALIFGGILYFRRK